MDATHKIILENTDWFDSLLRITEGDTGSYITKEGLSSLSFYEEVAALPNEHFAAFDSLDSMISGYQSYSGGKWWNSDTQHWTYGEMASDALLLSMKSIGSGEFELTSDEDRWKATEWLQLCTSDYVRLMEEELGIE